jgi:glyceraldehyde 3-phosphate dehydrogenase
MLKVGINGFGRIGRMTMRAAMKQDIFKVVAVNDLADNASLAHLLKYDSTYGILDADITGDDKGFVIDGDEIAVFSERDPAKIPWKEHEVDIVIESTGIFRTRQKASAHLNAGAERVIITAPGETDLVVVLGVNDHLYDPEKHYIISNASCTTNALAPVAKVLHENFGIKKGLMNTTHAYTNDQQLLDFPHSDLRRSRAATLSMIPTSTGAAKTVGEVIPELKGRIDGLAIRVPTPTVSLVDFVVELEKGVTVDSVNAALKKEADGSSYFAYSELPLVSVDYKGNPFSATVDAKSTMVIGENMVRVLAWYDNEWAYSCRVVDLAGLIASKQ